MDGSQWQLGDSYLLPTLPLSFKVGTSRIPKTIDFRKQSEFSKGDKLENMPAS